MLNPKLEANRQFHIAMEEWAKEHLREAHDHEVAVEVGRQLMYGLPPSEGLPDVRPNYPRYEKESES